MYTGIIEQQQPPWEKACFHTARFCDRMTGPIKAYLELAIEYYSKALCCGTKFFHQSMQRMLSLWLGFGVAAQESSISKELATCFDAVNNRMLKLAKALPAYQFLAALPQLLSRIDHTNAKVRMVMDVILTRVFCAYPKQTIWHLMPVKSCSVKSRADRISKFLSKIKEADGLSDELQKLWKLPIRARARTMSLCKDFKAFDGMANLEMIIPLQSSMTVILPASTETLASHNPFPRDLPTIASFCDQIEVMQSLQRPCKITIKGSDSRDYNMLCKAGDDLNIDSRMMLFFSVVNKLLSKDPDARKRGLHIGIYAVTPLNEECGLIECVRDTVGLRDILLKLYKAKNIAVDRVKIEKIEEIMADKTNTPEHNFVQKILPQFPPIFHEWFAEKFPEPQQWLSSRQLFSRTTAVMSMVGHIVGLGDRHGGNILLDTQTGAIQHIDFNCIFEKGHHLRIPERVPFRLTQNMVDAFGLGGVEGTFRASCEVTLRVLQDNRDLLMSVLDMFKHDPLREWSSSRGRGVLCSVHTREEQEKANRVLQVVDWKLHGDVDNAKEPPPIKEQVDRLISEATSATNLSRMYIGWIPFL
ncbi:hypothetical protein HK105_209228 [Polyrhizophydium stewartii]|uniref:non-specific serine/threonine protein kinase n=1 Tax=Polyrhizophydium stewartii TaxID=2732419 RepID=A0ABR4MVS3_9FUNG